MTPVDLLERWQRAYPDVPPVGFLCRRALPERWVRTHSLADAQRYPDTPQQLAQALQRYNATAAHVLGEDRDCLLFVARFGADTRLRDDEAVQLRAARPVHVLGHGRGDDAIQVFAAPVRWRSGAFDPLLAGIAEQGTGSTLFFDPAGGGAFAPYDGGADHFLASPEQAARMKTRFAAWLSRRPDGL
ncbi:DUF3885 domain-containing protein [Lysobacter enzymogenes]|uniref:DUF3885 domain-containing protein n=1 Tax=Lysobacter enzymogenes TaxID=69 RepID=UPI001AF26113|nr:hypothetical protein [Lysobacter enzymogenes]QQP99464.1 hypothetical protein JHW41_15190 [Lysobacter enzymogenes]